MITKLRGQFEEFEGSVHLNGGDPTKSSARLTIRAKSIQTGIQLRDDQLPKGLGCQLERRTRERRRPGQREGGARVRCRSHPPVLTAEPRVFYLGDEVRVTPSDFRMTVPSG